MKNSAAGLLTSLDDLFSTQEERAIAAQPRVEDIPVELIDDFPNHPFKVRMDGAMVRLVESVCQYGVLEPCLIRPKPDGRYEMVAGHRRKEACIMADCSSIRCIVQEMTDDQAVIPDTVRLAEISTADCSIFKHEPKGKATDAYRTLVQEVMDIGEKQRSRSVNVTR